MKKTTLSMTLAALVLLLTGCAQRSPPLYGWGSYQQQVYSRFKAEGSNPQEQISSLEESLQKIQSSNQAVPPGYHAHLGMLYAELGKEDEMVRQFDAEKTLFPESGPFMNFLTRKYQKQEAK